jgi:hypothetical protein
MANRDEAQGLVVGWQVENGGHLVVAEIGLLANDALEALYIGCFMDEDGEPLVGGREYTIHYEEDQLPPVAEFWSFTMYAHPPGFLTESSINRYAIGSLTPGLHWNEDGSVDIYLQRESPGPDKESNWLPTAPPAGHHDQPHESDTASTSSPDLLNPRKHRHWMIAKAQVDYRHI